MDMGDIFSGNKETLLVTRYMFDPVKIISSGLLNRQLPFIAILGEHRRRGILFI